MTMHDFTSPHIKPGSKSDLLRQHIMRFAETPSGFSVAADRGTWKVGPCHDACTWLVKKGFVVNAKRNQSDRRVFVSQADATRYALSRQPPAVSLSATKLAQGISFKPGAEIVWPAHIKPVCRMIPDRFAVNVPLVRIGDAGFSMSVGG